MSLLAAFTIAASLLFPSSAPAQAILSAALPERANGEQNSRAQGLAAPFLGMADQAQWSRLDAYQLSLEASELERWLGEIYLEEGANLPESLRLITEEGQGAARLVISRYQARPHLRYELLLKQKAPRENIAQGNANSGQPQRFGERPLLPRAWRQPAELPPVTADAPVLTGLHIVLDPGHLGGSYAKLEERFFQLAGGQPVCEGDMSLQAARYLKDLLEQAGARCTLIREDAEPATSLRPEDLQASARDFFLSQNLPAETRSVEKLAERLFYGKAEIYARAQRIAQLDPAADLVLCLHFNATNWGSRAKPTLSNQSHLHVLVNGCYSANELREDNQRLQMLLRLLAGTHELEIPLAHAIAKRCAEQMDLPAYSYPGSNARLVVHPDYQPGYVWARNLLANRIFPAPVIYLEPYVQNNASDYRYIQAGDYEGLREFRGKLRPSIYREYAQAVAAGVIDYYKQTRPREP